MKVWRLVFAIALALAAILVAAANWTAQPHVRPIDHPEFAGMQQSGMGAEPEAGLLWIGWSFGALQIAFFASMLALGARSRRGLRGLGVPLIAASLVYLAVWSALVLAYHSQASVEDPVLFLGFPAATAWMLFAIWPCPVLFALYYIIGFDRWIATPEDLAELDQKLARLRAESRATDGETDR
jgi:hypothetical protein